MDCMPYDLQLIMQQTWGSGLPGARTSTPTGTIKRCNKSDELARLLPPSGRRVVTDRVQDVDGSTLFSDALHSLQRDDDVGRA
jgi:hypothetical protein